MSSQPVVETAQELKQALAPLLPDHDIGNGVILMPPLELVRQMGPFAQNALELSDQAERAVIDTDAAYQIGTEFMSTCTQQFNVIEELRKKAKQPVDDLAKYIQGQTVPSQNLLNLAKGKIERLMLAYRRKVEAERQAAAEIIRKQQEAETLKLAEQEEAKGNTGVASAILDAATAPVPVRAAAPIGGMRTNSMGRSTNLASTWVGTAAEPMKMLQAIIDGKLSIACIEWKAGELNKAAKTIGVEGVHNGLKVEKSESLRQR